MTGEWNGFASTPDPAAAPPTAPCRAGIAGRREPTGVALAIVGAALLGVLLLCSGCGDRVPADRTSASEAKLAALREQTARAWAPVQEQVLVALADLKESHQELRREIAQS